MKQNARQRRNTVGGHGLFFDFKLFLREDTKD